METDALRVVIRQKLQDGHLLSPSPAQEISPHDLLDWPDLRRGSASVTLAALSAGPLYLKASS